jgi:DNA-directed RNA polymerase I subunit RPA2
VYYDETDKTHHTVKYKGYETATIDQVIGVGFESYEKEPLGAFQRVIIKWRINRNPTRGDKFSSRHGQKGVMSQLFPQVNMPFTGEGITPDVIINPNAFPSRMTIGMLIEIMAAKAGAIHGMRQDATPFSFDESFPPHKYFGDQLVKAGYNYYGNELLYSGITGEPFWAEVYFGVCYYQRLRHMVGDKFQVRSEGRTVQTTRQPIKGRKKGGGIRFGEMERDSILAHGVMTILKDRLLLSSDADVAFCCTRCGNMLTVWPLPPSRHSRAAPGQNSDDSVHVTDVDIDPLASNAERELHARRAAMKLPPDFRCNMCHDSKREDIKVIRIPYVLRLLVVELAALGVHTTFKIEDGTIALSGFPNKREKLA